MIASENPTKESTSDGRAHRSLVNIVASPEYRHWLHGFAESRNTTHARLVREALRRMAEAEGFVAPPKA